MLSLLGRIHWEQVCSEHCNSSINLTAAPSHKVLRYNLKLQIIFVQWCVFLIILLADSEIFLMFTIILCSKEIMILRRYPIIYWVKGLICGKWLSVIEKKFLFTHGLISITYMSRKLGKSHLSLPGLIFRKVNWSLIYFHLQILLILNSWLWQSILLANLIFNQNF